MLSRRLRYQHSQSSCTRPCFRGPGATVWGANAVNGVINIITKNSADTQGGQISALVGTQEQTIDSIRYGGKIGNCTTYRVFVRYKQFADSRDAVTHKSADDAWNITHGGFRVDWTPEQQDKFTFEGDYSGGPVDQKSTFPTLTPPFSQVVNADAESAGGNLLGRWTHSFSDTSVTNLQIYYDHAQRNEPSFFGQKEDTGDIDFTHRFELSR